MSTSSQEPEPEMYKITLYVKIFHGDSEVKNGVIKVYLDEDLTREYDKDWIINSYQYEFIIKEDNGNYTFNFNSSPFIDDFDEHGGSHWQVSSICDDFDSPIIDKWVQHQNIYNNNITDNTKQLTSQPLIGFQPNKSYCWRVRYRDKSLKWSEWSDPTVFFTDDNQIELKISPNPIVDESILSIPYYSSSKIKIFSIEGKLVKTYTKPNDSIIKLKNSDFKPGTYILKVFTDKMNVSQIKFIVI